MQPASHLPPDYHAKVSHEASRQSRRIRDAGHPAPLGDPSSGILFVLEQPVGPRAIEAIALSLRSLQLSESYVTWASTGFLLEEILLSEPAVLVAIGPGAAQDLDTLDYPLARRPFHEATQGDWFAWTKGTAGLLLPSLNPALDDDAAKRHFWRTFLSLQSIARTSGT